jgi:hypothetical protein
MTVILPPVGRQEVPNGEEAECGKIRRRFARELHESSPTDRQWLWRKGSPSSQTQATFCAPSRSVRKPRACGSVAPADKRSSRINLFALTEAFVSVRGWRG